ncbi:MAG: hypothetical protein AAF411_03945 [Myxococcota bacterium]
MNAPKFSSTFALVFAAIALMGCKVTAEDVSYWKRTVKGPGKIVAVILADRYELELRTAAAVALVEMDGRDDVDGVELLQQAMQRLSRTDRETATAIVNGMTPNMLEMMEAGEAGRDENLGPPLIQIRAKDAAYTLIPYANGEQRNQLVTGVVGWYAKDFANRSLSGNYSVEQVVRALGAPAAQQLVQAMTFRMPQRAMVKVAELIGQIGNDETKEQAGQRLVQLETQMESDDMGEDSFLGWMKSEISASLEDAGRPNDDARVTAIALNNRESFIVTGALPAMKHLASVDAVRNRLLEIALRAPTEGMNPQLTEAIQLRRTTALLALDGNATEAQLPRLLDLALTDTAVQDVAFDRIADIRSAAAIPRLWPMFQNAANEDLPKRQRWRAGELILALGGADVVAEFLNKLPAEAGAQFEPNELEGYATKMSQMSRPPTATVEALLSAREWYKRVIALRFIERRGTAADIPRMERLKNDRTELAGTGWAGRELATVGDVAENAIAALRERLAAPATGSASSMGASSMGSAAMGGAAMDAAMGGGGE